MKYLLLLLVLSSCITTCTSQDISTLKYDTTNNKVYMDCTWICVSFNPIGLDSTNVREWLLTKVVVNGELLSERQIRNWKCLKEYPGSCKKMVDVRVLKKDYTFDEFIKYLWP